MKTIVVPLLFWSLLFCIKVNAQEVRPESLVKSSKLNFAVPDLPAFNALKTEPGNLLRPSSPKEFSIIADQFYDGSNIIVPKSIAVEIAPITLLKYDKLTLEDYQKHPILYNSRISLGSLRDSINLSKLALGFRTSIINDGDIKSDKNLTVIFNYLRNINNARTGFYTNELKRLNLTRETLSRKTFRDSLDIRFNNLWFSKNDSLEKIIRDYIDCKTWNARKLDVAIAIVGSSPDSLAKNIAFSSITGWITYAHPINDYGQFMVGGNVVVYGPGNSNDIEINIPFRIYVGTNKIKGYAGGQYSFRNNTQTNNILFDLGCEYYIGKGFWLNFSGGFEKDIANDRSKLVSKLKISYAIPGNQN
jgi:hypothetical protein